MLTPSTLNILRADFIHSDADNNKQPWSPESPPPNPAHGQNKLFYMDLLALLETHSRLDTPNAKIDVVVAGAGPGYHFCDMIKNFSDRVHWHLYDPGFEGNSICDDLCKMDKTHKNVNVYNGDEGYLTESKATQLARALRTYRTNTTILFLSDIRTVPPKATRDYEKMRRDYEIRDMALQEGILRALGASFAMLKMKIPYPEQAESDVFTYLDGIPFVQPYARALSTEFRLFLSRDPDGSYSLIDYNKKKVEQAWSFYNRVTRPCEQRDAAIAMIVSNLYALNFNVARL